ncbi:2,3-bisphosphoglycerate-dependent phosphoglycerate mutase [Nitrosomonas sp. Nm51]|uniref:2,3-bisphosphoglycerate-dependent phosphoglycerate mutase n=1 Tax=Nitrosomonas sp. Nm51 TaxID=133720 RepID=UPI0008BA582B|nr:2,3-bisphosphoglycerate-dependent phosphoglycerate mutase [Nitrosomonas sp. Nm51]SEQ79167.1 2,3-bisphosphoglycerate-dependent phosphoglycerate mutase [Nitrosomonas sp. Nm51]
MTADSSFGVRAAPGITRLVLLRHGQSIWNRDKIFTGWSDVALSPEGEREAAHAGYLLQQAGFTLDCCFSSTLQRASGTAKTVLSAMALELPVQKCWRLNERHYGALEGMGRLAAVGKFGLWPVLRTQIRYDGEPPRLKMDDARFPGNQSGYAGIDVNELPQGESLKLAAQRLQPYWQRVIRPELARGRNVLIVSHKNLLRTLMGRLDHLPARQMMKLKLATGRPLVYELDRALEPVRHYYMDKMP